MATNINAIMILSIYISTIVWLHMKKIKSHNRVISLIEMTITSEKWGVKHV